MISMKVCKTDVNKISLHSIILQLQLTLELSQFKEILSVYSDLLVLVANYSFIFENSSSEIQALKENPVSVETALISQDPARDGVNWYGYAGQNPVNYKDPLGLRIMNHSAYSSMSKYTRDYINNTNSKISEAGCAITALANVITEIMHANNPNQQPYNDKTHSGSLRSTTPKDINKNSKNFNKSNDELNWVNAAKNYGLTAKRSTSKADAKKMIENAEKSNNQQYVILKVPITIGEGDSKKDADHWVGHSGKTLTIDGVKWIEVVPSSDYDYGREKKNSNWMQKDGKMYIKENAIQATVLIERNNHQEGKNEKNKN